MGLVTESSRIATSVSGEYFIAFGLDPERTHPYSSRAKARLKD
jgi:hypothetical protein